MEFLLHVAGLILFAAATYGGIRVDLRNMKDQVKDIKADVIHVHERLDKHLERHQ